MQSKLMRAMSLTASAALLLVSFQNCGKAGFQSAGEADIDLSSLTGTDDDPFAFDASVDQISYNSCFGTSSRGSGFFTLKAGAYSNAGVKATSAFMSYVNNGTTIKPMYPETTVSKTQIKQYLSASGANVQAVPQMAIRTRSNVQQVRIPSGGAVTEGVNVSTMLGNLTDDRWMDPIITGGTAASNLFFTMAPSGGRRLESTLTYNSNEGNADAFRNDFANNAMLALTFKTRADLGDATSARAPAGASDAVAYGRGHTLTFGPALSHYTQCLKDGACNAPNTALYAVSPPNILTSINEVNLQVPTASVATWTCDAKRRYTVVRTADAALYCPPDPVDYLDNSGYRREYEIVRRHLSAKDWDVSLVYRCVVPKNGGCYDAQFQSNGSPVEVQYDQTQPCRQALAGPASQYGSVVPPKVCAQFVSICTK